MPSVLSELSGQRCSIVDGGGGGGEKYRERFVGMLDKDRNFGAWNCQATEFFLGFVLFDGRPVVRRRSRRDYRKVDEDLQTGINAVSHVCGSISSCSTFTML